MSKKVYLTKTLNGLIPSYDSDKEALKGLRLNETYQAEIKQPRNVKFHKKYWALINLVFTNLPEDFCIETVDGQKDYIKKPDDLHWHIKCQCGIMDKKISLGGKIMYEVGSISFQSMDEPSFAEFYDRALNVVVKYFLVGTDKEEIANEIEMFF